MRVLVTGCLGFVGRHLMALLGERGATVFGLDRRWDPVPAPARLLTADLAEVDALRGAVKEAAPDLVFHLAGLTASGGEPAAILEANAVGTLRLLQALADNPDRTRVVLAGSSAQYGLLPEGWEVVTEDAPLSPVGVYGWSKVAAEAIALSFSGRSGLEVIAARAFNHVGPGEPDALVCSALARGVAAVEAGRESALRVGDLTTVRDFCDVRDIARGYLALAEKGAPGRIYNLCSGRGTPVSEVLELLLGMASTRVEVRSDPAKAGSGIRSQVGSAQRARTETGWTPGIPLERSLADLLAEWRERFERGGNVR
jgi:GDP-4-dehydro-6-deoxy-D-mannose reductase